MPVLNHNEILKLHALTISARLAESRDALLSGIHVELVAYLARAVSPGEQILRDLEALNDITVSSDGGVPLARWIANAIALIGPRSESAEFVAAQVLCRTDVLVVAAPHHRVLARAIDALDGYKVSVIDSLEIASAGALKSAVGSCAVAILIFGSDDHPESAPLAETLLQQVCDELARHQRPVLSFFERLPHRRSNTGRRAADNNLGARARLLAGKLVDYYHTPQELASRVVAALTNWRFQGASRFASLAQSLPPQPRIEHPYPLDRHFTGRCAARSTLTAWLDEGTENVLVLEAMGGVGKSALAWFWLQFDVLGAPGPGIFDCNVDERKSPNTPIDGVFWWSFYELNSRFPDFLREAERYARGATGAQPSKTGRDLVGQLIIALQSRRILLILDGFERELLSYSMGYKPGHGDRPPDGDQREARRCIDPDAVRFLQAVVALPSLRSRILITTRLFPSDLQDRSNQEFPGCRRLLLGDFQPDEVIELFASSGVRAEPDKVLRLTDAYGRHPLTVRLLIGVVLCDPFDAGDLSAIEEYDPIPHLIRKEHHVLQIAYESLPRPDQHLLSGIAAYRGPVDERAIEVVERAGAKRAGAQARGRAALKAAVNGLLGRNILLREERRGVFDLHPVVRKYAYDRLVNKRDIHLSISHYVQSFAADLPIAERGDLDSVIELFHQQVAAGLGSAALHLLFERIHPPLVGGFYDVRTALELFGNLVPKGVPMRNTWNDNDICGWFNHEYGMLLRRAGLIDRASDWRARCWNMMDMESALHHATASKIAERSGAETIEVIRSMRACGRLSDARDHYRQTCTWPMDEARVIRLALDVEEALTLTYAGAPLDALEMLIKVDSEAQALGCADHDLLRVRALRYRSLAALLARDFDDAITVVEDAERRFRRSSGSNLELSEEAIALAAQRALATVALFERDRTMDEGIRRRRSPLRREAVETLVPSLLESLGRCHEHGLMELETDVLLALGCVALSMTDRREARHYTALASTLSDRGGLRLRRWEADLLEAAIAIQDGGRADASARVSEVKREASGEVQGYLSVAFTIWNLHHLSSSVA